MRSVRPRLVELVVCDDVRREVDRKTSWMGVYPGRVIVTEKLPAFFPKLCFIYILGEGYGTFSIRHQFVAPDGEVVFQSEEGRLQIPSDQISVSLSIECSPVQIEKAGAYLARLILDDDEDTPLEAPVHIVEELKE